MAMMKFEGSTFKSDADKNCDTCAIKLLYQSLCPVGDRVRDYCMRKKLGWVEIEVPNKRFREFGEYDA